MLSSNFELLRCILRILFDSELLLAIVSPLRSLGTAAKSEFVIMVPVINSLYANQSSNKSIEKIGPNFFISEKVVY